MKPLDLTGQQFGRLTVIERAGNDARGRPRWQCQCECGTEVNVDPGVLRRGTVTKCFTACSLAVGRRQWPVDSRYFVGEDGSVVGPQGRVLRTFVSGGYPRVNMCVDGRHSQFLVHVVVCETFHGPRPEGKEAAHENGVPADCRAANLSWKTPTENNADKVRHGTDTPGERNPQHKLTEVEVYQIRRSTGSEAALAERFNVSRSNIGLIRRRQTWRHVS